MAFILVGVKHIVPEVGQIAHHGIKLFPLTGGFGVQLAVQHALNGLLEAFFHREVHQAVAGFQLATAPENRSIFDNGGRRLEGEG